MNKSPRRVGQDATGAEGQFQQRNSNASSAPFQSAEITAFTQRESKDEIACKFLRSVLPELGYYVALIIISEDRKENRFTTTIAELWRIMKEADEAGHTAYHACATFKEARYDRKGTPGPERRFGRTKHNAAWAKALWADIDVGPKKHVIASRAFERCCVVRSSDHFRSSFSSFYSNPSAPLNYRGQTMGQSY